ALRFRFAPPAAGHGAGGNLTLTNNPDHSVGADQLGIPMTISSDPRHGVSGTEGISVLSAGFPKWPDAPGFAAIGDPTVTRTFAETVSREYRAVGITMALSPQADVATDPRWSRISGTFGEDFATVAKLAAAYVEGIQGKRDGLARSGVAAVVKHFAGYGAQRDGWDSHNFYGRYSIYPGKMLERHIAAFRPSLDAAAAGVMPTYSIIQSHGFEPVGGAFSRHLVTDILRKREHYSGLVLSDFGITENCTHSCIDGDTSGEMERFTANPGAWRTRVRKTALSRRSMPALIKLEALRILLRSLPQPATAGSRCLGSMKPSPGSCSSSSNKACSRSLMST
ncbi:MAG: hypothetical protein DI555_23300, partial [Novosphingobium pentaromativorans]